MKIHTKDDAIVNIDDAMVKVVSFTDVATLARREHILNYANNIMSDVTMSISFNGLDCMIKVPLLVKVYTENTIDSYESTDIVHDIPDLKTLEVNWHSIMRTSTFYVSKPDKVKLLFATITDTTDDVVNNSTGAISELLDTISASITTSLSNLNDKIVKLDEAIANIKIDESLAKMDTKSLTWLNVLSYIKYKQLDMFKSLNVDGNYQAYLKENALGTAWSFTWKGQSAPINKTSVFKVGKLTINSNNDNFNIASYDLLAIPYDIVNVKYTGSFIKAQLNGENELMTAIVGEPLSEDYDVYYTVDFPLITGSAVSAGGLIAIVEAEDSSIISFKVMDNRDIGYSVSPIYQSLGASQYKVTGYNNAFSAYFTIDNVAFDMLSYHKGKYMLATNISVSQEYSKVKFKEVPFSK